VAGGQRSAVSFRPPVSACAISGLNTRILTPPESANQPAGKRKPGRLLTKTLQEWSNGRLAGPASNEMWKLFALFDESLTQKNHSRNRAETLPGATSLLNLGDVCPDEQIKLDL
jgi:hypothetical protein